MKKCEVCGGIFEEVECPYSTKIDLPLAEDYAEMRKGMMEHSEHQRNVARWVLHGAEDHAENILSWAKKMMQIKV